MKKLINISSQIKNNTFSYTGKGSFESAVNNHKDLIINWLEELQPLQRQIEMLFELTQLEFQKRNYTRILTKVLPEEYKEFVCVNILVRDSNVIAQYYTNEFNLTLLYEKLVSNRYLKYPGKNEKYADYNTFQQFVMMYKSDLSLSLESKNQHTIKEVTQEDNTIDTIDNGNDDNNKNEENTSTKDDKQDYQYEMLDLRIDEEVGDTKKEEIIEENEPSKPEKTNWTQLLLGKGK